MDLWNFLESHPMHSEQQQLPDVYKIALEEWLRLKHICRLNDVQLIVDYDADYFLHRKGVLAVASRTMFLIDNVWTSGALNSYGAKGSIIIKVNPFVPNGWYVDDGSCNIGYRYDLRSVLRHELVHGAGFSSSVTDTSVGYEYAGKCFPTTFDQNIILKNGNSFVNGCTLTESRASDVFIGDVQLYNPPTFLAGSSFSHTHDNGVMFFSVPPMTCIDFDKNAFSVLNSLGARCPNYDSVSTHYTTISSASYGTVLNLYILFLFIIIKCQLLT